MRTNNKLTDEDRKGIDMKTVKMKFKDAPIGARFKYPKSDMIFNN